MMVDMTAIKKMVYADLVLLNLVPLAAIIAGVLSSENVTVAISLFAVGAAIALAWLVYRVLNKKSREIKPVKFDDTYALIFVCFALALKWLSLSESSWSSVMMLLMFIAVFASIVGGTIWSMVRGYRSRNDQEV